MRFARNTKRAVLAAAVGGMGVMLAGAGAANASILGSTLGYTSYDTVYADSFNAASPVTLNGTNPTTETGLDGGSATSAYLGVSTVAGSGAADAVWTNSGSGATDPSPPTHPNGSGAANDPNEDGNNISNVSLPLTAQQGDIYDFEATLTVPSSAATGGHGLEMGFCYNNENMHLTSAAQALSNNDPAGLVLYRDAVSGGGYFDIFEGTGTNGDTHFSPTAGGALTGGSVGTAVTVDILLTPTGATTATLDWYLNGTLAGGPTNVTGLTSGITDISFGNNQDLNPLVTNFSLTAAPVPEPASMLGLLGAGGLALLRRRPCTKR